MNRLEIVRQFYDALERLRKRIGGPLTLSSWSGGRAWPRRGVYFFFEHGEVRSDSGGGARVVRIGTHALAAGSATTLWNRLSQHAGTRKAAAGNHRGSIFRLLVGEAMKRRENMNEPRSWGIGSDTGAAAVRIGCSSADVKDSELALEQAVSRHVCAMPFLFVAVDDHAGPDSARGQIERKAIALLSNYQRPAIDPPTNGWLGNSSGRRRVRESGLWNNNQVDETSEQAFLGLLNAAVDGTAPLTTSA